MNQAIYQLADTGRSVRIVVQKKKDGSYILGISNGKDKPLIRQGELNTVDAEFEAAIPGYLESLKSAAIEAKLKSVEESVVTPPAKPVSAATAAAPIPAPATAPEKDEQPELDFGF